VCNLRAKLSQCNETPNFYYGRRVVARAYMSRAAAQNFSFTSNYCWPNRLSVKIYNAWNYGITKKDYGMCCCLPHP